MIQNETAEDLMQANGVSANIEQYEFEEPD